MKHLFFNMILFSLILTGFPAQSQEKNEEQRIIIHPEMYMPRGVPIEKPVPLLRTLKLTFKLSGSDGKKEIVLLCATSVYGAEVKGAFGIGGTLGMIHNNEMLLTFDFEAVSEKLSFSGNGSIKIRIGDEKVVYKYGDYSVTIKVEPEE